jgi:hypothetical protein
MRLDIADVEDIQASAKRRAHHRQGADTDDQRGEAQPATRAA